VAIGILLVVVAAILAIEMKGLLIGESATEEVRRALTDAIETAPSVNSLIHLRTMHLAPEQLLVAAKIEYDRSLSIDELAPAVDATEVKLRAAVPYDLMIYIEPDIRRAVTP